MSKNSISIDGEKLRAYIEAVTGKTVYEISKESGFSKNLLAESMRKGVASPVVQAVLKLNGIDIEDFKALDKEAGEQMTLEQYMSDLELLQGIKEDIKGAIEEMRAFLTDIEKKYNL